MRLCKLKPNTFSCILIANLISPNKQCPSQYIGDVLARLTCLRNSHASTQNGFLSLIELDDCQTKPLNSDANELLIVNGDSYVANEANLGGVWVEQSNKAKDEVKRVGEAEEIGAAR